MKKETKTIVVAILVAASLVAGYLAGGGARGVQTVTPTSTTTVTIDPPQAVASAYLAHIQSIQSQNVSALASQYEDNATLGFSGVRGGKYSGAPTFGSAGGIINGSVVAQDVYEHVSNDNNSSSWSIARETWDFTQSNVQCIPATTQSSSSTTTTTSTTTAFTIPTCYETLDTVINPAPKGTVYMKVVTDQEGTVITNGTLYVTQSGKTAYDVAHLGGTQANYCIELGDVNGTGYLQLAANATFIVTGYYNVTLMAGYDQGPWYLATIPLIQVPPNSNSTVYVTVSVPSGMVTVVTSNEGSSTVTTTTTSVTTIKNGG